MKKIFLDTDIGSDIDDAFALVFLLKSNDAVLIGVSTLYRNAFRRAKFASRLIRDYNGGNIPVYAGIDMPISQIPEKTEPSWVEQIYDKNGKYLPSQCLDKYMDAEISSVNAVQAIMEAATDKDVEFLTIGPGTNLATAIRIAPELFKGRKITMMAGCYGKLLLDKYKGLQNVAEWNVLADPEAMNILFTSKADLTMVGLNVSLQCVMPEEILKKTLARNMPEIMKDAMVAWKKSFMTDRMPVMYDPVAVAAAIYPQLFAFEKHGVRVGLKGKNRGVILKDSAAKKVIVATDIDKDRFFEVFVETLLK